VAGEPTVGKTQIIH
jgi:GTPase SAR1 family protein